jgi:GTPase SAR1 family protein
MQRILIIGVSGSGKSTLAQRVSERLGLPYFATDPFYWEPNWRPASPERVRQQLRNVLAHDAWVLDGNFDDERTLVWSRADCIVWLDYSLPTLLRRVIARDIGWFLSGQEIWSGNKMTFQRAISGIRHTIRSYPLKRVNYPKYIAELSAVEVHRFRASRQAESWLANPLKNDRV